MAQEDFRLLIVFLLFIGGLIMLTLAMIWEDYKDKNK
tara:strand:- start:126 stop:236 length:111 start_codon:yes stop_codon:yes gene_type:complete